MKQSLQLKLGQSLTMTPQLQQAIRLLQLSTLDLQNEIQETIDSNPMLEIAEPEIQGDEHHQVEAQNIQVSDKNKDKNEESVNNEESVDGERIEELPMSTDHLENAESEWNQDIPSDLPVDTSWEDVYQTPTTSSAPTASDDEYSPIESRRSNAESLHDHLLWQLNLISCSDRDYTIAITILDDIQSSGLLSTSIEELYKNLSENLEELELDEVIAVLRQIQQFDPPGVAAQGLSDCLLIQLQQLPDATPFLTFAKSIVQQHLSLLGSKDYKALMRKLHIKEETLKGAIQLIQTLNPHPGDGLDYDNTEYVVPDVFVKKKTNHWTVELNPDIAPKLRINNDYASMVKRADASEDNTFLKNNLQEARWFLKSLQSRNETLLKVATAIVEKQQGFLDYGEEAMKPLVLHDIAETVEMHESTISRVTTNKYMHTPQGIFELKYFFSSHVSTDTGGECSSTAIRSIVKKLIKAENPKKPLSDNKITQLLADEGIKVARRTIAKYRESMNIPPSNERKSLF